MRAFIIYFAFASILALTGCGSVYRVGDPVVDRSGTKGEDRLLEINLDDYKFVDQRGAANGQTAYAQAVTDTTGVARNRLQMAIMTAADKHCAIHKSRALATFNNINLWSGLVGAGLAGAAAVAKGEIAQRLAAGAGFAQAARTEANTDIYRQALIEAIFKALDNERQRQEQLIQTRRSKGIRFDGYPVDDAIRDAFLYADACSIYEGVTLLNQAVANANPCKVLRDRLASLEADIAKTTDVGIKTLKQSEYSRLALQLSACSGTE
jgi:hypothetical protein